MQLCISSASWAGLGVHPCEHLTLAGVLVWSQMGISSPGMWARRKIHSPLHSLVIIFMSLLFCRLFPLEI